jgi:hypothetical protein
MNDMSQQSDIPDRIWVNSFYIEQDDLQRQGHGDVAYIRESIIEQRAKIAAKEIGDKIFAALSGEKPINDTEIAKIILNTLKGQ